MDTENAIPHMVLAHSCPVLLHAPDKLQYHHPDSYRMDADYPEGSFQNSRSTGIRLRTTPSRHIRRNRDTHGQQSYSTHSTVTDRRLKSNDENSTQQARFTPGTAYCAASRPARTPPVHQYRNPTTHNGSLRPNGVSMSSASTYESCTPAI